MQNILDRFKTRLPSISGFMKLWRPTDCAMCYFWRLCLVSAVSMFLLTYFETLAYMLLFGLFAIGGYYGVRTGNNEL